MHGKYYYRFWNTIKLLFDNEENTMTKKSFAVIGLLAMLLALLPGAATAAVTDGDEPDWRERLTIGYPIR